MHRYACIELIRDTHGILMNVRTVIKSVYVLLEHTYGNLMRSSIFSAVRTVI